MDGGGGVALVNKTVAGVCSGAIQSLRESVPEVDSAVCGEWETLLALNDQILKTLVHEGSRSRHASFLAETVLRAAAAGGRSVVISKLFESWSLQDNNWLSNRINNSCAVFGASSSGHMDVLHILLSVSGVDVDAVNVQGASALSVTCQAGHLESLEILLEYGASINFKDREGATPLYQACAFGKGPVVERLLVTEGIDIDCQNHSTGATSLHIACQNGYENIVRMLLPRVAVNEINRGLPRDGCTPLYIAVAKSHDSVVQCLLEEGSQGILIYKSVMGSSPLQAAQHYLQKAIKQAQAADATLTCEEEENEREKQKKEKERDIVRAKVTACQKIVEMLSRQAGTGTGTGTGTNHLSSSLQQQQRQHQPWCRGDRNDLGKHTKSKCEKHHGLIRFKTPSRGFGCDVCGRSGFSMNVIMFGCDECNYDVCSRCIEASN